MNFNETLLTLPSSQINSVSVPEIDIQAEHLLVLTLPYFKGAINCLDEISRHIIKKFREQGVYNAQRFSSNIMSDVTSLTLVEILKRKTDYSTAECIKILNGYSLKPDKSFLHCLGNERKIITLEIAMSNTDILVYDTEGVDPSGIDLARDIVAKNLGNRIVAAVELHIAGDFEEDYPEKTNVLRFGQNMSQSLPEIVVTESKQSLFRKIRNALLS